jgi:hypothetical protein
MIGGVRFLLASAILAITASAAMAQEQESKLLNRLLKPDRTLQNSEQNKKFVASGSLGEKQINAGNFYVADKPAARRFQGDRDFAAREFPSSDFRNVAPASLYSRSSGTYLQKQYVTSAAPSIHEARESSRSSATHAYAGSRPFLGKGLTQKAISQHDHPMSIDEIRELLNRNK